MTNNGKHKKPNSTSMSPLQLLLRGERRKRNGQSESPKQKVKKRWKNLENEQMKPSSLQKKMKTINGRWETMILKVSAYKQALVYFTGLR